MDGVRCSFVGSRFLILVEQIPNLEIEEKITQFIQFLWDCGFEVGNSVRILEQCESEGNKILRLPPIY